jgi:hypothetical protein
MDRYHREISRTGDEAVLARVEAVARAERTREPDGAPDTGEAWLGGAELERAAALNRAELQHQEAQRRQREIKRHAPRIRLGDTDPDGESPLWEDLPG